MKLPLVPQRKALDAASAELLNIFNPQAYKVGAAFVLLPAYLHFVVRRLGRELAALDAAGLAFGLEVVCFFISPWSKHYRSL